MFCCLKTKHRSGAYPNSAAGCYFHPKSDAPHPAMHRGPNKLKSSKSWMKSRCAFYCTARCWNSQKKREFNTDVFFFPHPHPPPFIFLVRVHCTERERKGETRWSGHIHISKVQVTEKVAFRCRKGNAYCLLSCRDNSKLGFLPLPTHEHVPLIQGCIKVKVIETSMSIYMPCISLPSYQV